MAKWNSSKEMRALEREKLGEATMGSRPSRERSEAKSINWAEMELLRHSDLCEVEEKVLRECGLIEGG